MQIISNFFNVIEDFLNLVTSINNIIIIILLIIFYQFLSYFLNDKKYINSFIKYKDPELIKIKDLKAIPIINIILPAWKEGEEFRQCLMSITKLSYPKLKVVVNAGGNEETINIANSYKMDLRFIILQQKGGSDRPSLGKIKAINECLGYISEGLLYFIDADAYFYDEILLRLIYPIINLDKDVVVGGRRPIESSVNKDFVKYVDINRSPVSRGLYSRDDGKFISGANTCMKYEVVKRIGIFSEDKKIATDKSMADDIIKNGFKIFQLVDPRSRMPDTSHPQNLKSLMHQNIIWMTNSLIYDIKFHKSGLIKSLFLCLISFYLLIFPIFLFFNFGLFIISFYFLLLIYFKRIRRIIIHRKITDKRYRYKLSVLFFFKIFYYIYLELTVNLMVLFDFFKNFKKFF